MCRCLNGQVKHRHVQTSAIAKNKILSMPLLCGIVYLDQLTGGHYTHTYLITIVRTYECQYLNMPTIECGYLNVPTIECGYLNEWSVQTSACSNIGGRSSNGHCQRICTIIRSRTEEQAPISWKFFQFCKFFFLEVFSNLQNNIRAKRNHRSIS